MKHKLFLAAAAVAVFGFFFVLAWAIVRVLSQDFRALVPAVELVAAAISASLSAYVFHDATSAEENQQPIQSRTSQTVPALGTQAV